MRPCARAPTGAPPAPHRRGHAGVGVRAAAGAEVARAPRRADPWRRPVYNPRPMESRERFRFRDDVLRSAASRTRRRLLLSIAAAALAIVGVWAVALRPQGAGPRTLAFAIVLLAVLAALSLRSRLRRLHARWSSFEVTVDDEGVGREVAGAPPIRIARADVASIEERVEGLVVRDRAGRSLLVPREVEGYARACALLTGWLPPASPRS